MSSVTLLEEALTMDQAAIEKGKNHFGKLIEDQMKRMERVKAGAEWIDYSTVKPIMIGVLGGDGIGPFIAKDSRRAGRATSTRAPSSEVSWLAQLARPAQAVKHITTY
jgi:hypothetical protein